MKVPQESDGASNVKLRKLARSLLRDAGVYEVIPTRLDVVSSFVDLEQPLDLYAEIDDLPPKFKSMIRRLRSKVRAALSLRDRLVYVDRSLQRGAQRFAHAHEIAHHVLPWHTDAYAADDLTTLSPRTGMMLEREANSFAAELLFQCGAFEEEARDYRVGLAAPLDLAQRWDSSYHAAIRRYVEGNIAPCALAVLGRYLVAGEDQDSCVRVLYGLESESFNKRYGAIARILPPDISISASSLGRDAATSILSRGSGPTFGGIERLVTQRGALSFRYELFFNQYAVFVLLYRRGGTIRRSSPEVLWRPNK